MPSRLSCEVLGHRALTPEEVQELLPPTLDALTFLHGKGLVQGHLKPANVLVVDDQLKLASDSVRPASEPRASIAAAFLVRSSGSTPRQVLHGRRHLESRHNAGRGADPEPAVARWAIRNHAPAHGCSSGARGHGAAMPERRSRGPPVGHAAASPARRHATTAGGARSSGHRPRSAATRRAETGVSQSAQPDAGHHGDRGTATGGRRLGGLARLSHPPPLPAAGCGYGADFLATTCDRAAERFAESEDASARACSLRSLRPVRSPEKPNQHARRVFPTGRISPLPR